MYPRYSLATSVFALLAVFPSLTVLAAEQALPTVVVTATRFNEADPQLASNISIITREDIRNTPAQSLPDVLGSRAGIFVSSLGGKMGQDAKVDMRGFGTTATSNTLILVDGQRVNPVDMGSIIWSSIPLDSVERIEVIRGSGSVLYGDGATGGVINIVTNKSGKPVAAISASAGSTAFKSGDVHLANGNDQAYYNLFINVSDSNGYRRNAQQDQQTASGRVGLLLDRGELFSDFAVYKESAGLPGSIFSKAYRDDPRSTRTPRDTQEKDGYRIRPGISYQINERIAFEAEAGVEHQNLVSNTVSWNSKSDRDRDTLSVTPRLRWRHGLGDLPSETVFGIDFYDSEVKSRNTGFANQRADQKSTAYYLQNLTGITSKLSLSLGAREQRVRQSAAQDATLFKPSMSGSSTRSKSAFDLGLSYTEKTWRIYGKTGTTFRFANVDELFGMDPVTWAPVFAGNIKPQHGKIHEIGGSLSLGTARLRASIYRLNLNDEIGYDGNANTNFSPTRRNGAELEADWKISKAVHTRLSYTHTDAKFRSGVFDGKQLPLVARHQASAQLSWDSGKTGLYSATARYVGNRRYDTDFSNVRGTLDGYTTLDLQAVWDFRPWKLTAKVLNATDKKYAPYAGYSASRNDHYFYPADERSFLISGRYDF